MLMATMLACPGHSGQLQHDQRSHRTSAAHHALGTLAAGEKYEGPTWEFNPETGALEGGAPSSGPRSGPLRPP